MSALDSLMTPGAPERAYTFVAPYSTVSVTAFDLDDHFGMRAAQLATLLRVIPVSNHSALMLSLAGRLADEINEQRKLGQFNEIFVSELAELLLRAQGEDGPCDLLWLAQQIADEMAALISCLDLTDMRGAP